ncbi:MAG: hypothetical protein EOS36_05600 [Mesorhizobium sp.]|uniref:hypothetical protein n=1 Tax=Mesorhizobium sp. TaxID=1871066 RepID=UPI000FE4DF99|nr:hypothetical protein [Mesorhizobium sp.]RWD66308.1 MAG: hypothetical protein EOS36_05600 [Mesorhizobium sp.]RWE43123.1 MAG: hypothetical protein EOS79_15625 [Mesorhizobium sp.]
MHGAKVDRLMLVRAPLTAEDVRVPASLFAVLLERFQDHPLDETFKSFLGARAGDGFLGKIVAARPDILEWPATANTSYFSSGSLLLLAALNSYDLLPEAARERIVGST